MPSKLRNIEVRVFTSHEDVERADLSERANMSKEERLILGRELHAFWVRSYFPNATRLERTVQVVERQGG